MAATDAVYAAADAQGVRLRLRHPTLERLHKAVRGLSRLADEAGDELIWGEVTRRLRRYCFLSAATPLPFDHLLLWDEKAEAALRRARHMGSASYSTFSPVLEEIAETLKMLQDSPVNPLWQAILNHETPHAALVATRDRWAILIADSRAVAAVEVLAKKVPRLTVVTSYQLQDDLSYSGLIVLGASRWFPEYCFTAPRAHKIQLLQFAWLHDDARFQPAFLPNRKNQTPIFFQENQAASSATELFEVPMPAVDWTFVLRTLGQAQTAGGGEDEVLAHAWALEGHQGLWLEDSAQASILTLNMPAGGGTSALRMPVRNLQPGMFVLLRSEGGGDLIVPVADRLLGHKSTGLRALQEEWKRELRLQVRRAGTLGSATHRLKELGSVRAHGQNIRNWMFPRSIRPDAPADFRAVLALCGLEQRLEEFNLAMDQIDRAHRAAGHRISKMILEAVAQADTTPLRRGGVQVFELPQGEGGNFTAYRLLERSPYTAKVSYHDLNHVFPLED